jgi:hypothetical protein
MLATASDNSSSLSLALDARMAVKALYALQRQQGGAANGTLKKAIEDVRTSLDALRTGSPLFANLSQSSSFENYDQIQTLQEVQSTFSSEDVGAKLEVVNKEDDPVQQKEGIEFAITFFTALERRARQKFNQSYGFGI